MRPDARTSREHLTSRRLHGPARRSPEGGHHPLSAAASISLTRALAEHAARLLRVRWIVRSPIIVYRARMGLVFGPRMLMLEHTGRITGTRRYVVLEIVGHPNPDTYVVVSGFGAKAQWYRNVRANPRVRIWLGSHPPVPATARPLSRDEATATLAAYAARYPRAWGAVRPIFETTLGVRIGGQPTKLPLIALDLAGEGNGQHSGAALARTERDR
jgi:deazaflavin-dependent oxidoreductase (nitroreductase family)